MLIKNSNKEHKKFDDGIVYQMGMNTDSSKSFDIISNRIYSKKNQSIIRELILNGIDASKEAGVNIPIEIHFPTFVKNGEEIDDTFYVQDFGIGMSQDVFENIFCNYFKSTKENNKDLNGGFGLGGKSPFLYTESFTVETTSPVDNVRRTYELQLIDKIPTFNHISIFDIVNSDIKGTKISFKLVSEYDSKAFSHEVHYFMFSSYPIQFNDLKSQDNSKKLIDKSNITDFISSEFSPYHNGTGHLFIYNCSNDLSYYYPRNRDTNIKIMALCGDYLYAYDLTYDNIDKIYDIIYLTFLKDQIYNKLKINNEDLIIIKRLNNFSILLKFYSGEISLTISRENIEQTAENRLIIKEKLDELLDNEYNKLKCFFSDYEFEKNDSDYLFNFKNLFILKSLYKYFSINTKKITKQIKEEISDFLNKGFSLVSYSDGTLNRRISDFDNKFLKQIDNEKDICLFFENFSKFIDESSKNIFSNSIDLFRIIFNYTYSFSIDKHNYEFITNPDIFHLINVEICNDLYTELQNNTVESYSIEPELITYLFIINDDKNKEDTQFSLMINKNEELKEKLDSLSFESTIVCNFDNLYMSKMNCSNDLFSRGYKSIFNFNSRFIISNNDKNLFIFNNLNNKTYSHYSIFYYLIDYSSYDICVPPHGNKPNLVDDSYLSDFIDMVLKDLLYVLYFVTKNNFLFLENDTREHYYEKEELNDKFKSYLINKLKKNKKNDSYKDFFSLSENLYLSLGFTLDDIKELDNKEIDLDYYFRYKDDIKHIFEEIAFIKYSLIHNNFNNDSSFYDKFKSELGLESDEYLRFFINKNYINYIEQYFNKYHLKDYHDIVKKELTNNKLMNYYIYSEC